MNEIDTLTLEIITRTPISNVEIAQETAEIIINALGYHKEQSKISPLAIILARDLEIYSPLCKGINCAECRYKEFTGEENEPSCGSVKHAEALIALGWTNEKLSVSDELNVEPINCADCKYLKILNKNYLYGICQKTGFEFTPFKTDTRTHTCQFAKLKEAPNGSID